MASKTTKKAEEVVDPSKDKLQTLKEKMEKRYGKGIIISGKTVPDFEVISTGSHQFDKITDCGGIPVGKLIELYGPESSGKSTLALHIIAEFQKSGKKCLLMDYEYSFDKYYARKIGVDDDALIISQPDTMEDGYNIVYEYIKSGGLGLVVIDSHTAMVPKQRFDGEIGDAKMAPEARVNSDGLKKVKAEIEKAKCTVLGISQLRAEIGKMGSGGRKPTGGNAWKFYPDMRINVYRKLDKVHEANKTFIEVQKNKCGKPYGKTEISIGWGIGIDKLAEMVNIAVETGVLKKNGNWFEYNGSNIGNGIMATTDFLGNNPDVLEEMTKKALPIFHASELQTLAEADIELDEENQ